MANPRQRRKAKSSTHKVISHSKRAKRLLRKMPAIRGPKTLQDAWDPSKTPRQNYLALGLQYDLNPISSGGSEVNLVRATNEINEGQPFPTAQSSVSERATVAPALPPGFGRIIRDSSGNIVHIELPNDEEEREVSQPEPVIDAPVIMKKSELQVWADDRPETWQGSGSGSVQDTIVRAVGTTNSYRPWSQWEKAFSDSLGPGPVDLESLAASAIVQQRHTSEGERLCLERLVRKYGDDLQKMARDRRLNPEQRTANELRRAIAKAGGVGVLRNGTAVGITE